MNSSQALEADDAAREAGPQTGTVVRLGPDRRFGYVSNAAGTRFFIFVTGYALSNREAALLQVGSRVRYAIVGQGRVEGLTLL